jgi:hypothetical protein
VKKIDVKVDLQLSNFARFNPPMRTISVLRYRPEMEEEEDGAYMTVDEHEKIVHALLGSFARVLIKHGIKHVDLDARHVQESIDG